MQTIGRYEVVRSLGRGGMGEVYLARDPKLERQVAIKLLNRDDGAETRALFEREAKALAALNHPNIVTVFEIAEAPGGQFIAMEYLPGRALRDLLQNDKPSREDLVAICGQVAIGLAAAHDAGILHRDIKPENVVVGKALSVKVVDFGIARRLDAPVSADPSVARRSKPKDLKARAAAIADVFTRTLRFGADGVAALASVRPSSDDLQTRDTVSPLVTSMTRTAFGTPAYMAPEMLMGEPSSTASDVYSLGVMLHECLTGHRPYDAPNLHEVIARVIDGTEKPLRIDDPLADLVARMIDRDPAKRPDLAEIAKALSRRRSTIAAPAPARRTRLFLLAGVVVAVVGVLVIWQLSRSTPSIAPAEDRSPIAIIDVELELPSYGAGLNGATFAEVLARLLETARVPAVPPTALRSRGEPRTIGEWTAAARQAKAKLLARGSIVELEKQVIATFEIFDVASGKFLNKVEATGDPDHIAKLLLDAADVLADVTRPGSQVERGSNPKLAATMMELGNRELREHDAGKARTFFEQAVLAAPSAEAWDRYAYSLAMMAAKRSALIEAAREAYERAPEGTRKHILHATLLIYEGKFVDALAEIAPFEHVKLSKDDQRDVLFALGECHWHEGRHDLGYAYFKRTLELDGAFAEAASHAGEYALARRDEPTAREYLRMQRMSLDYVEFAMGRYEELAAADKGDFTEWAEIVLGRPVHHARPLTRQQETYERLTLAAAANDLATVDRETTTLLGELDPFTSYTASLLVNMTEVVVGAAMKGPTKRLLDELGRRSPTYNYHRLSILAAPMLGAPKFPRAELTERLATLQEALDAELAGDRKRAAKLLDELVKNPTFEWDFLERLALKRNLDALGNKTEARALCDDTLKPATMRFVFRVVRRICTL